MLIFHAVVECEIDPTREGSAHTPAPVFAMMIRAIQGHSLPQVIPERVYTPLSNDELLDIGLFVHGTDLNAFWNIMRHPAVAEKAIGEVASTGAR